MLLSPKKVKYRKWQKARCNRKRILMPTKGSNVCFGDYGIQAITKARISSHHIEATRRVVVKTIGKDARMWIRIFPDRPYTKKPSEVGMGKGKGNPEGFEVEILPGKIIYEFSGVTDEVASEAARKCGKKLPLKVKITKRD